MIYVALVTLLILAQYLFFVMQVGTARAKGDVKAPALTGDDHFERCLRVQSNTVEQLVVALPAMWVCATYFRADVAAILGLIFLISRFVYSFSYIKEPKSRGLGFIVGFVANVLMILCGFYAVISGLL